MSTEDKIDRIGALFARIPQIKFAYIFGSCARGDYGPASDIDVAVFLDRRLSPFAFRLCLIETMLRELGTERFDLIILNNAPPVLKYEVVRQGLVIKEDKKGASISRRKRLVNKAALTTRLERLREYLGILESVMAANVGFPCKWLKPRTETLFERR